MPDLDPFTIDPQNGFNRLQAYWYATLCRTGYFADMTMLRACGDIAGAVHAERFILNLDFMPWTYLLAWPDHRVLIMPNGTTQFQQYLLTAMGTPLTDTFGWTGQVNGFFAIAARGIAARIRSTITTFNPPNTVYCGHSLGGAVAALLLMKSDRPGPAAGLWSCGQPRVGNLLWALSFSYQAVRLTNSGDPIPMLPPSTNTIMDVSLFPFWNPLPFAYRHFPTRIHLEIDGTAFLPPEFNSLAEGTQYLVSVIGNDLAWTESHDTPAYARRCRMQIPVAWRTPHADWPGIEKIDEINHALNGGEAWSFDPPTVEEPGPAPAVPPVRPTEFPCP